MYHGPFVSVALWSFIIMLSLDHEVLIVILMASASAALVVAVAASDVSEPSSTKTTSFTSGGDGGVQINGFRPFSLSYSTYCLYGGCIDVNSCVRIDFCGKSRCRACRWL